MYVIFGLWSDGGGPSNKKIKKIEKKRKETKKEEFPIHRILSCLVGVIYGFPYPERKKKVRWGSISPEEMAPLGGG